MALLDFPASPTVGQNFTAQNGYVYQWDGTAWIMLALSAGVVVGGDLTGNLPNPQIAPGAIVDADVGVSANLDGAKFLARSIDGLRLAKPVYLRVYRTTSLVITAGLGTAVPWEAGAAISYPTAAGLSWTIGAPTKLSVSENGIYVVGAGYNAAVASSLVHILIMQNGGTVAGASFPSPGYHSVCAICNANAGQYFETFVLSAPTFTIDATYQTPNMYAVRIA